jgi:hypothetical protein
MLIKLFQQKLTCLVLCVKKTNFGKKKDKNRHNSLHVNFLSSYIATFYVFADSFVEK